MKLIGAPADAIEGRCLRVVRASLAAALFALLGWLVLETSEMSDAANAADLVAAMRAVLGTSFGHDPTAQALSVFAALVLLAAWPQRWPFSAVGLAGLALALQTGHSHAFAMEHGPSLGRTAPPCRRCLAWRIAAAADSGPRRPAEASPNAETLLKARHALRHRYCRNDLLPGWVLGGGVAGLVGTAYGSVLLLKAALFAALLGLAATNRFRLTLALERQVAQAARWVLLRTIAAETALGLMVVLAAGVLSGLESGIHARHRRACAVSHALT
jgi:putative copper export protein